MNVEGVFCDYFDVGDEVAYNAAFIRSEWSKDGIKVFVILDNPIEEHVSQLSWEGFLPLSDMEKKAKDLEVPIDDVVSNTKEALTDSSNKFQHELNWNGDSGTLIWTKLGEVNVDYGSVQMKQLNDTSYDDLPDVKLRSIMMEDYKKFNQSLKETKEEIEKKSKDLEQFRETNAKLTKEHQDYVEKKEEEIDKQQAQFIALLNTKKLHNLALQEEIKKLQKKLEGVPMFDSDLDPESQKFDKNSQDHSSQEDFDLQSLPKRLKITKNPDREEDKTAGPSTTNPPEVPEEPKEPEDDVYLKSTQDDNLLSQIF
ncbi:hypothetical protein DMENIID0001_134530 [Sergentomyia squamirostris]